MKEFRVITGNTNYHTNTCTRTLAFEPGKHNVRVEYRTPGQFVNINEGDWNGSHFILTRI